MAPQSAAAIAEANDIYLKPFLLAWERGQSPTGYLRAAGFWFFVHYVLRHHERRRRLAAVRRHGPNADTNWKVCIAQSSIDEFITPWADPVTGSMWLHRPSYPPLRSRKHVFDGAVDALRDVTAGPFTIQPSKHGLGIFVQDEAELRECFRTQVLFGYVTRVPEKFHRAVELCPHTVGDITDRDQRAKDRLQKSSSTSTARSRAPRRCLNILSGVLGLINHACHAEPNGLLATTAAVHDDPGSRSRKTLIDIVIAHPDKGVVLLVPKLRGEHRRQVVCNYFNEGETSPFPCKCYWCELDDAKADE